MLWRLSVTKGTIAMLQDADGNEVTDHQTMAGMLWHEYKDRMGRSELISMQFDLARILQRVDGLQDLTRPFEEKEMHEVVRKCQQIGPLGRMDSVGFF
jgi:hypothetical protein